MSQGKILCFDESIELWDSDKSETVEFVLMERGPLDEVPSKVALGTCSMRDFRATPERRVTHQILLNPIAVDHHEDHNIMTVLGAELHLVASYSHDVFHQTFIGGLFTCFNPCVACPASLNDLDSDDSFPYTTTPALKDRKKRSSSRRNRITSPEIDVQSFPAVTKGEGLKAST